MALFRSRDSQPVVVNVGTDDSPQMILIEPRTVYDSDDPQDRVVLDARLDLFREAVSVEQATAGPGEKRGVKR